MDKKHLLAYAVMALLGVSSCNSSAKHKDDHNHEETQETSVGKGHIGEVHFSKKQADAVGLRTETVHPSEFVSVIRAYGRLQNRPEDVSVLASSASGTVRLASSALNVGAQVKKGEKLFVIEPSGLGEGNQGLKAKLEYETAEKEFRRAENLVADNIISRQEYDRIKMRYDIAKSVYESSSADITNEGVNISAPFDGYVSALSVENGEYVTLGQSIAQVIRNSKIQLKADVPQTCYGDLDRVTSANFKTSFDDIRTYRLSEMNGKIISCGRSLEGSYVPVVFEFDNDANLLPGTFVDVYLTYPEKKEVIAVPIASLIEEQGVFSVYVKEAEDIYRKQPVSTGSNDGERVVIVNGIKDGDEVVCSAAYNLKLAGASSSIPAHTHNH